MIRFLQSDIQRPADVNSLVTLFHLNKEALSISQSTAKALCGRKREEEKN